MVRFFLMLLSVIPGMGPILLGRVQRGLLLLLLGGTGWVFLLAGTTVWAGPDRAQTQLLGAALGIVCTFVSVVWTHRLTSPIHRRWVRVQVERALDDAQRCYLRGRMQRAQMALDSGLVKDDRDIDLLFLDWQVSRSLGNESRARRSRRRLRRFDLDEKWLWEVQREEAAHGG
ncbi:MAG: hypothetical protein VX949_04230 [Planctomycetota bacterium]|nr:hypothetical protein [Planctomycetota bacterium]